MTERLLGRAGSIRFAAPLYAILALLSFPTFSTLVGGTRGLHYRIDVFDDGGGLPRLAMTVADWGRHGLSWWNPQLTAGNDRLAQAGISALAPDTALAFLVGPFAAYSIVAWLMVVVAAVGMHLFLRDAIRLAPLACVAGSIVYLFGFWHYIIGFSALAAPLGLWLADRTIRGEGRRWAALAGWIAVDVLMLYQGQSQVAVIAAALQVGWVVLVARGGGPIRRPVGSWAGAWALSVALYGPVLLAQLVALPLSQRTAWDLAYLFDARLPEAIGNNLAFYSSLLFGLPVAAGIGESPERYGTFFPGILGLGLLVVAVTRVARRPLERAAAFVVGLLVAIPILDLSGILATTFQDDLGFLRSFQLVRVRHFYPVAVAAAVAIGADAVFDGRALRRDWWGGRARIALVVGLAGAAGLAAALQVAAAAAHLRPLIRRLGSLPLPDLAWLVGLGALAAGSVALAIGLLGLWRSRRVGGLVLVGVLGLLVADRALFAYAERLADGRLATFESELGVTAGERYILDADPSGLGRVLTIGDHANRMAAVGLDQADGYQTIYPRRYQQLFGALTAPHLEIDPANARYFHDWGGKAYAFGPELDPELASLLGIRWVYADDVQVALPGFVERFRDGHVVVLENTAVIPRAFVAEQLAVSPDREALLSALRSATRADLATTAFLLVGDSPLVPSDVAPIEPGPSRAVSIATMLPDRIDIDVGAGPPGVLVLADVYAPGWVAEVPGESRAILPVDLALRGVAIDGRAQRVVLRYEPLPTYLGFVLAGAALVVTAAWLLAIRRRDRATLAV